VSGRGVKQVVLRGTKLRDPGGLRPTPVSRAKVAQKASVRKREAALNCALYKGFPSRFALSPQNQPSGSSLGRLPLIRSNRTFWRPLGLAAITALEVFSGLTEIGDTLAGTGCHASRAAGPWGIRTPPDLSPWVFRPPVV
jgi:hypothetical protein